MHKKETVYHTLVGKRFARFRTFNGKKYEFAWADKTKAEELGTVKTHRMGGRLVRMVKTANGYAIYTRSKAFYTKKRLARM